MSEFFNVRVSFNIDFLDFLDSVSAPGSISNCIIILQKQDALAQTKASSVKRIITVNHRQMHWCLHFSLKTEVCCFRDDNLAFYNMQNSYCWQVA